MFSEDTQYHIDEVVDISDEETSVTTPTEQLKLPALEAIAANPKKGFWPIAGTVVVSFFVLRWLMKS